MQTTLKFITILIPNHKKFCNDLILLVSKQISFLKDLLMK